MTDMCFWAVLITLSAIGYLLACEYAIAAALGLRKYDSVDRDGSREGHRADEPECS
jgi:hypothetical protein